MTDEAPVVYIVDDDISVRDAVSNLLRTVGLKVETFATAQEFLVLDVRLPGFSGLDLQRHLTQANLDIPIIFITAHGDIRMSVQAMKAGAVEFLAKPFRDQDLLDAVMQAIDRDREARSHRAETAEVRQLYEGLSSRQREVMALVVQGLLNKQIAGRLGTSEATIKLHRGQLMRKMRADSVAALIRMAEKIGLSSGTPPAPPPA